MCARPRFAPPNDLKFSIGDQVRMVSYDKAPAEQREFMTLFGDSGKTKKSYLETIMTISDYTHSQSYGVWCYRMEEDGGKFVWPERTVAYQIRNSVIKERGIDRPMPFI